MLAGSNLETILQSGQFAVTAELGPPKGTNQKVVLRKAEQLRGFCDAVNITDNQTAIVRMSSLSVCILLKQMGLEPVMQITCRDRNRLAIQADILGAVGFGVQNFLCLSGDHQKFGNHPTAKNVFDLDSIQLIQTLTGMRDQKKFASGDDFNGEAPLFVGAAANPFADPFEFRVIRLGKKVRAGASFIQTQPVFDLERFSRWMEMVRQRGLDQQTHILAGITPIKSAGMARYMRDNVAGVGIPPAVVERIEKAQDVKAEGLQIALEMIEQVKQIPGVHGVHVMAVGWEDIVPTIAERAGLLPRPTVEPVSVAPVEKASS